MEQSTNPALTKEIILDSLRTVFDPEIPVSVVDLGLIYDVKIIDAWVGIKMTLTAPGCGLAGMIANNVRECVKQIPGVNEADVRIVWHPQWNPSMMSEEAKKRLGWKG